MSVPRSAETFGSLLRHHRVAAGLTQTGLAERSGISLRTVQQLEGDIARPRRATVGHLIQALSISGPARAELETLAATAPGAPLAPRSRPPAQITRRTIAAVPFADDVDEDGDRGHTLVALPQHGPLTNVPWPVSSLLGREADLAVIRDRLTADRQRMVTLIGVGGAGKTRLAVQVATELLDAFAGGVWFIELAPTSSPALVPRIVADALGVRAAEDANVVDALIASLRRRHLLLVLDNCEHLIDACAELAERLLAACPELQILATSREPLRISGEQRWQVPPLAVPPLDGTASRGALADTAAVRLFAERASAIDVGFRLTDENVISVARVCARLDGIPLAIELAASRMGILSVEQIDERLNDGFRVLTGGTRTAPIRQQTMEAALNWSYTLLSPPEQATFRTLSVFAGGFDLQAAEAVVGDGSSVMSHGGTASPSSSPNTQHPTPNTPVDILELLSQLVDKSLVVPEQRPVGRRYRLLEPVRQYAERALAVSGEGPLVRAAHAAYYAALAERVAPLLRGPEQVAWLDRLEAERDNLRAALTWTAEHGSVNERLRLAVAVAPYWDARGYLSEGRRWLETMLAASRTGSASDTLRMRALLAAGTLARWQRDLPPAEVLLTEALEVARRLADRRSEAEALGGLASTYRHLDMIERAVALSDEAVRLGREIDDEATLAAALHHNGMALGAIVVASGTPEALDRTMAVLEESLMLYRRRGDVRQIGTAATVLGRTTRLTGDHRRAATLLREAVLTLHQVGDPTNLVDALGGLSHAAMALGESQHAARWLAVSQALRRDLGMHYSARNHAYDQAIRDALLRQMTVTEFDAAYAAGEAMSLDQVLAELRELP